MTIYEKAVAVLPASDIDHHESDLYLKLSKESAAIVSEYPYKNQVHLFVSQIDGCAWYDVPFGYLPYWAEKCKGV